MFYYYDDNFFENLKKPDFQPPKSVFKYVWSILFILMGISFILILYTPQSTTKVFGLAVFILQFFINLSWTVVFFKNHNLSKSLILAYILTFLVFAMLIIFFKLSILAGILQIPYFLWLIFACILNKKILELNK